MDELDIIKACKHISGNFHDHVKGKIGFGTKWIKCVCKARFSTLSTNIQRATLSTLEVLEKGALCSCSSS